MGNSKSRSMTYEQYYEAVKRNPGSVDISELNPYEVLGLSKNFEWEELKEAYRRVAKLVHPDKGGSDILFQKVTECFKQLALEYKSRQADRPHYDLRQESMAYYSKQSPVDIRGTPPPSNDANFLDRFNNAFEENRLEDDTNNGGYGHIMEKSSKSRDDISIPAILKGKVSAEQFNKTFDTVTLASKPAKEVVKYREPEALSLARKLQYTELGGDKPDDYSSGTQESSKRSLQYTDYMKAHTTTRLVDPRVVEKKKQFRTVEEYQIVRDSAAERGLTEDEIRHRAENEAKEKAREEARVRRLSEYDNKIAAHHERVNRLFVGYN